MVLFGGVESCIQVWISVVVVVLFNCMVGGVFGFEVVFVMGEICVDQKCVEIVNFFYNFVVVVGFGDVDMIVVEVFFGLFVQ